MYALQRGLSYLRIVCFLFMNISPHSSGLASSCLAPCLHLLPSTFQDVFFTILGIPEAAPNLGSVAAFHALHFSISCFLFPSCAPLPTHTPLQIVLFTPGVMGSKLLFCVSELMNTPHRQRSGEQA